MDYIEGYKDAIESFENVVNSEINKLINGTALKNEAGFAKMLDSFISTLYITKLQAERMEDDYVAGLTELFEENEESYLGEYNSHYEEDCDDCEAREFCLILGQGKTLKEIAYREEF